MKTPDSVSAVSALATAAALAVLLFLVDPGLRDFVPPASALPRLPDLLARAKLDGRGFRILFEIVLPFAFLGPLFLAFRRRGASHRAAADGAFLSCALLVGAILRVHLWATKSFWLDTYALKAALRNHTFREILSEPLGFDQSAPLGFCLLGKAVGELAGWSDHALSFPLLLVGLAVLGLVPLAVSRAGAPRLRAPAALLVALSPHLVYYSAEFKQYGLDALFAALSLLAAVELAAGRRPRAILGAVFVAGPLFSHTQFFLLPGLGLVLFLATFRSGGTWRRPPRPDLELFAACGALGAAATAVSFAHTMSTMPDMMFDFWSFAFPPRNSAGAWLSWWTEKSLMFFREPFAVLPVPDAFSWFRLPLFLPVPAILLCGCFVPRRSRPCAFVVASSLVLLVFASTLRKWPVATGSDFVIVARHLLFLLPAAFFFLACGLEGVARFSSKTAVAIVLAGTICVSARLLHQDDLRYSFSWPEAIGELAARSVDGAPILLGDYHSYAAWAYEPEWVETNRHRIFFIKKEIPELLAEKLDELSRDPPPDGFWILWADRGVEGKMVPAVIRESLKGFRVDFVRKSPAGNLRHYSGRPAGGPGGTRSEGSAR